jgi:hypothetical protein
VGVAHLVASPVLLQGEVQADQGERDADRCSSPTGVLGTVRIDHELMELTEHREMGHLVAGHLAIELPARLGGVGPIMQPRSAWK